MILAPRPRAPCSRGAKFKNFLSFVIAAPPTPPAAKRKMSVTELTEKVGITMTNISILKNGKAKAIRLSTLEAVCKALGCQPGDILEYKK